MKQIILVTGANGQLGNELRHLASTYPQFEYIFVGRDNLAIDDFESVRKFFRANRVHYCINCAAYTAVDKAETEKEMAFRVNAEAPGVLATVCKDNDCSLVHISTDYVFDGNAQSPYDEETSTNPQSVYGASKLEGEKNVMRAFPDSIIIRTSWVYSEYGKNFVKTMLRLMKEKKEIAVVNDQLGSPTYAADLAHAIMKIVSQGAWTKANGQSGLYHYCNEGIISWFEFAAAIKELSGNTCKVNPITTTQYPTPAKRPAYSVLSTTKISQQFRIIPPAWKSSLQLCIEKLI